MILRYEIINGVVGYVIQNPSCTYDEYVQVCTDYGLPPEMASYWVNMFIDAICSYLVEESSIDKAIQWLQAQTQLGLTLDQVCDKLIAMIAFNWTGSESVVVTRNNQVYREIKQYDVDLSQPPSGVQQVHFSNLAVNLTNNEREVVVLVGRWAFHLSWEDVPEKFKRAYVVWLRFQNLDVPPDLQTYDQNTFNLEDLLMEVDLDKATLIER